MDVYGLKGKPLNVSQLYKQLKDIVSQSQYPATPVGLLTSLDRDTWGSIYHEMIKGMSELVTSARDSSAFSRTSLANNPNMRHLEYSCIVANAFRCLSEMT